MGITIADNFNYRGTKPLDARFQFATISDMKNEATTSLYDGCFAYVTATKQYFTYDSNNEVDSTTGKWRIFESGGGGAVDSVNGKTGTVVLNATDVGALPDNTSIPSKTSDLNNDSGFITKSVNDLTNYSTTTEMNTALGNKVNTSSVGTAGGVAELDNTGKVPSSQLPSYVDDVVDGYYKEADGKFYEEDTYTTEITGEAGKIYISVDTDIQYRWTGSAFAVLGGALTLGETSSTAYRGDRGKTAYDHSQLTSGNPHNVSKSDVGLGNVDNTSDANKPISTATQTALDSKEGVFRYSTMPTASADYVGKIVQYIGTTTQDYTNGFFYECVNNNNVYSWSLKSVQSGSDNDIQVDTMPTLSASINGKIYQYVGSDETTYKTGHFYQAVYEIETSWKWGGYAIGYTLKDKDNVKVGDTFYSDIDCTQVYGTVASLPDNYGNINVLLIGDPGTHQVTWQNSSHTISSDVRWKDLTNFDTLTDRPDESSDINIDDLNLTMPSTINPYPIGFDESGQEYVVSYYRRSSDGKVKPIYRYDLINLELTGTENSYNLPFRQVIDVVVSADIYNVIKNTTRSSPIPYFWGANGAVWWFDNDMYLIITHDASWSSNRTVKGSIFFTKTTDSWKDLP